MVETAAWAGSPLVPWVVNGATVWGRCCPAVDVRAAAPLRGSGSPRAARVAPGRPPAGQGRPRLVRVARCRQGRPRPAPCWSGSPSAVFGTGSQPGRGAPPFLIGNPPEVPREPCRCADRSPPTRPTPPSKFQRSSPGGGLGGRVGDGWRAGNSESHTKSVAWETEFGARTAARRPSARASPEGLWRGKVVVLAGIRGPTQRCGLFDLAVAPCSRGV